MSNKILYIVVPCYNEAPVLADTSARLRAKLESLIQANQVSADSKILFVDDGSKDATWSMIQQYHQENPMFTGVKLSRNRGQQCALLAGLTTAHKRADLIISIDADLQDDINAMDEMLKANAEGAEIVYGVRSSRKKDSFMKRFTAQSFYKVMNRLGVETIFNHADYRLMTKTALGALLEYQESNLFVRGLVPQLGYQTAKVEYEREKRLAGESKYSVKKMVGLAVEGITSFSTKPLLLVFWLGVVCGILGGIGLITTAILYGIGLMSMLWPLLFGMLTFTGVLLVCLGIVGVYVGKTYLETKHRPRYFIEKELLD